MVDLAIQRARVLERLQAAERAAGRPLGGVQLLAVSKTQPVERIRELAQAGQRRFGENYLQEAQGKFAALAEFGLEWHFIGPIQSNKTRALAAQFAWVQSVDRLKIAERLNAQRPAELPRLNICLEVNVSGEATKSGVHPEQLWELAHAVALLPRLRLRGLMTIPAPNGAHPNAPFRLLRELFHDLQQDGIELDTLSMGMSDDLESAVAEGATLVRIGTALFGPR